MPHLIKIKSFEKIIGELIDQLKTPTGRQLAHEQLSNFNQLVSIDFFTNHENLKLKKYFDFKINDPDKNILETFHGEKDEYASFVFNFYLNLMNEINEQGKFKSKIDLFEKYPLTDEEEILGIEIKKFEYFEFEKYVTPQFNQIFECVINNQHLNLHKICYERIKND
jgi:hypothetical protein